MEETLSQVRKAGGEISSLPVDLCDEKTVEALVESARKTYGSVHHVLNFAATYDPWIGIGFSG